MALFVVILGPPGAGKGTQARRLLLKTGLIHISSGDIFRENLKNQTELGIRANEFIEKGNLVPDDITIAMIEERLSRPDCFEGAILDGFPRTPHQADTLDDLLAKSGNQVNVVPYIKVPDEILIGRLTGRWICYQNGHIFHEKFNHPRVEGVCDIDGSRLFQREDDKHDTVLNRIQVYFQQTSPLIHHYQNKGLLVEIDGTLPIDQVTEKLIKTIKEREIS